MRKLFAVTFGITLGLVAAGVAMASRDSGGTYTLPIAYNPVVSGQPISSVGHNATMSDIATALSDSLSRSGKGGMTAPLRTADGSASAPSWAFTSQTGTGFWLSAPTSLLLSMNTTPRWRCTAAGCGPIDTTSGASYDFIALAAPALGSGTYTLTLPTGLQANTRPLLVSSAGAISLGSEQATDAVAAATANTLVVRDASGRAAFASPSATGDAATKGYVDAQYPAVVYTTADLTDAAGAATYTNITGLSFAVSANKDYYFSADLVVSTAAATTGVGIQATGPAAPTQVTIGYTYLDSSAVVQSIGTTAFASSAMPADMPASRQMVRVVGIVRNGANAGTVQLQFATETNAVTVTVHQGSTMQWKQLN